MTNKDHTINEHACTERGLANTRHNRRWLAFVRVLSEDLGQSQDDAESNAWKLLDVYEATQ